ncbi:bifunctional tRNA (5-methylaminomethyl-2-thiouridine)(34)-methyltransferase MnmD/FAD-dependent 5-carboxymethylaminomethyl-2-thiouridine(34) oxidoreductase MnmC [Vibrio sp. HN007]|uniref:bifunctional tRNA (5-methylaminomethyl-2-thiouridine)(34)-methyltransferase MnmD/FAD-dependent 5-carboxymethylaminomethyl-2-thiouridine(34) oxidoreductase MnmC n=1 Tax=Vibrio iocasae TaxID=3098914 RepID=UPI0035D44719
MTSISNADLGWNESGTPVSEHFDDVYFSNVNGLEETRYVFLKQNHLPERWQSYDRRRFVIAETGFGTGLNFLAVWQWFEKFRQENPDSAVKELHFISFEKFPLRKEDLIKAHEAWPELSEYAEQLQKHYPIAVPECHRVVLADGAITLDLWFGDIKECMPKVPTNEDGIVNAWFLDGFAPSKNPEMWNQDLFNNMAKLAKQDCTCATFTAAGFVRRGLIQAGFDMKKVKGFGTKRDMIAGNLPVKPAYTNHVPWYSRPQNHDVQDIAIIGGGIASATLARSLVNRGIQVSLYCADSEAAMNASGNRQGAVYPLLNGSHTGLSRVFAPAFIFARQFVEQAAERFPFDHDWCGVTQLAWNDKAGEKLDKMLEGGFTEELIQKLSPEATANAVGLDTGTESVSYPLGGWLCPKQLTQGLISELNENECFNVYFNHSVDSLEQAEDGSWAISVNGKTISHQAVVIANGHKFSQFEQAKHIAASSVKGQVSHIPTTETLSKLKTVLCYDGYMTPQNPSNGHHCIGASYDRENIDQVFDQDAQAENGLKLARCLPQQDWVKDVDTSGNQSRQGVRCVTRDHLPFVGNICDFEKTLEQYADLRNNKESAELIPVYQNLFGFIGLGSRGLSSAPLMAELLASQIAGDPLPLPVDVLEELHTGRMWVRRLLKGKPVV